MKTIIQKLGILGLALLLSSLAAGVSAEGNEGSHPEDNNENVQETIAPAKSLKELKDNYEADVEILEQEMKAKIKTARSEYLSAIKKLKEKLKADREALLKELIAKRKAEHIEEEEND